VAEGPTDDQPSVKTYGFALTDDSDTALTPGIKSWAHIAGRLNPGFDREIGALPPSHLLCKLGGLVRASGFRSGFRRPAMWVLEGYYCR
jgi:hypothetical protein